MVNAIHDYMREHLGLDDIRVCPHDDADGGDCCKPKPGLLLRPPLYDMASSAIVGDRWRDIEADPPPADGACGVPSGGRGPVAVGRARLIGHLERLTSDDTD